MVNTIKDIFNRPIVDLGEQGDPLLRGILSPIYNKCEIDRFMSSYYNSLDQAQSQAKKIDLTSYYFNLISEALSKIKYDCNAGKKQLILDVGCGFGSTTLPLVKLFPKATIIASELSIAMLSVLKEKLDVSGSNCVLLQLNTEDLDFRANSVDMIVGGAILHHLFRPDNVLGQSYNILKPGGIAIFFEPFENGMTILGLIYQSITKHWKFKWLNRPTKNYFKNCISVWQKMKTLDKTDPFFTGIDDKWFFTKHYFEKMSEHYLFDKCIIYPLEKSNKPFEQLAKTHFEGNGIKNIPKWIWEEINKYEEWFSEDAKKDFLTEGCIILKK